MDANVERGAARYLAQLALLSQERWIKPAHTIEAERLALEELAETTPTLPRRLAPKPVEPGAVQIKAPRKIYVAASPRPATGLAPTPLVQAMATLQATRTAPVVEATPVEAPAPAPVVAPKVSSTVTYRVIFTRNGQPAVVAGTPYETTIAAASRVELYVSLDKALEASPSVDGAIVVDGDAVLVATTRREAMNRLAREAAEPKRQRGPVCKSQNYNRSSLWAKASQTRVRLPTSRTYAKSYWSGSFTI